MNAVPWLRDQIEYMNINGLETYVYKIPNKSFIRKILAIINLRRLMRKSRFSLIHCHWGYNAIFAYNNRIPLITTYHGSDLQGDLKNNGSVNIKGHILIILSKIGTLLSTKNIFVSKELKNLKPKVNLKKKDYIIPMGFNSKMFLPLDKEIAKKNLGLDPKKKYVLFAGNYSQKVKNYSLAEKAMNHLDTSYQLIKLNYAEHSNIPNYMNASDVLLMTSFQEGAPVIIKEALACNLAIVSTDVGDVKEIIKFIPGCFINKDRDPKKIAQLIEKSVLTDSTMIGIEKVKIYDAEKINYKVKCLYIDLLKDLKKGTKYIK